MSEPTEAAPAVVATLLQTKSKSTRISGRSGRYSFKPSPRFDGKLALEFTSLVEFERAESDIRQVIQRDPIVTIIGSADPVSRAVEAIETLIGSRLTVNLDRRREGLEKVVELASAELKRFANPPTNKQAGTPAAPVTIPTLDELIALHGAELAESILERETALAEAQRLKKPSMTQEEVDTFRIGWPLKKVTTERVDNEGPADEVETPDEATDPVPPPPSEPPSEIPDEATLMKMEFNALKALAKERGINDPSRKGIVVELVKIRSGGAR